MLVMQMYFQIPKMFQFIYWPEVVKHVKVKTHPIASGGNTNKDQLEEVCIKTQPVHGNIVYSRHFQFLWDSGNSKVYIHLEVGRL